MDQRRAALEREVISYVKRGYRAISQTDTSAQLVRPKRFSFPVFLILFLTGIGPFIYVAWYLAKRDAYLNPSPLTAFTTSARRPINRLELTRRPGWKCATVPAR